MISWFFLQGPCKNSHLSIIVMSLQVDIFSEARPWKFSHTYVSPYTLDIFAGGETNFWCKSLDIFVGPSIWTLDNFARGWIVCNCLKRFKYYSGWMDGWLDKLEKAGLSRAKLSTKLASKASWCHMLPVRLPWCYLPSRLSFIEVVFHWGCRPLRLSSI